MTTLNLAQEQNTQQLAKALKESLHFPCSIYLKGEIGAGKTSLTRYLLQELGVKGRIKSPTYAILEQYNTEKLDMLHVDLYRLSSIDALEETGFFDLKKSADLCLVEWPEKVSDLASPDLLVEIRVKGDGREVFLNGFSKRGEQLINDLLQRMG